MRKKRKGRKGRFARANFDDQVPRNILRSQLPVGPQREIRWRKLWRSCSERDPVPWKFLCFTLAEFYREVWWSRRHTSDVLLWEDKGREAEGGITLRLSLYAARSPEYAAINLLWVLWIFTDFFLFLSTLSAESLYPVWLSTLIRIRHFMSSSVFCPNGKRNTVCLLFWLCPFGIFWKY